MKVKLLGNFPVGLLFLAFVHLNVCDGKGNVEDGELAQELKDLSKLTAREGSTFGKHLSKGEKAAFERQRARELKALTSGCTNDNCDALRNAVDLGGTRRSLQYLPDGETNETNTECLSRACMSDYEICVDDSDCASYLSECLETDESTSEACQQYRSKAWVAVKYLIYCYDSHCGGDGVQSEREKLEEELLREWDEEDVCQDHPQNRLSCDENIHCMHQNEGEDSWCSHEDARVMCRDCAGPGQKCESARVCSDELLVCDQLTEEEKEALDPMHPCVHESCVVSHHSSECEDLVFDHCCNPDIESCDRTERSTCSSMGCSQFTDSHSYYEVDYEMASCPFGDANGTCSHPLCDDPSMFREIIDLFVGNGDSNYCYGPWCFQQIMVDSCLATTILGGANETNSTENGRRRLSQLILQGRWSLQSSLRKEKGILSSFQSNIAAPMQLLFPSRRRMQLLNKSPNAHGNRYLETAEGSYNNTDPNECLMLVCPEEFNECLANEDCAYFMDNCTDDSNITSMDCDLILTNNATMDLIKPLEECHRQECNSDVICVKQSCPDVMKACTDMDDCNYVLFHCTNDDPLSFGAECETRSTDQVEEMVESVMQCHGKHCNNDPIMQCIYNDCEHEVEACHLDTGCAYLLDHCMDEQSLPTDCEEHRANNATGMILSSIEQCYMEQCSHLDVHGPHDEFRHTLEEARQCLEKDEDGCAWAKEECDEDLACSEPLAQLFQCEADECAGSIVMENIHNKAFAEVINCFDGVCEIGGEDDGDDDGVDYRPPSIHAREECATVLSSYCNDHPEENACQQTCPYGCKAGEFCPCANDSCLAEYAAPMCARSTGPCHEYKEGLRQLYLDTGYYQPQDEWSRNRIAHFLMDPPPENLSLLANLPLALETLGDACNAIHQNLADHISSCMGPSIDFCNANEWDQGCRTELSTCGDGVVSWHESCDDGNQMDGDGCSSWCYPDAGYICPEQDEPCQKCLRDERAEWGDETVCKFCSENSRVNVTSPCFATECQGIEDYEGAKACDDHVEHFCAATAADGLRDLGCDSYVRKDRMYTVPTIPNKCEYKIKSFSLNAKSIHRVKLAVFTCKFEDPHGALDGKTPLFKYQHPYDRLSSEEQKSLPPTAKAILDTMLETRQEKLIPLNELRLDDFSPYVHPSLKTDEGRPLHIHDSLARLVVHHEEPEEQDRYDSLGNLNCHREGEYRDLLSLPATSEPLKMGLKAFLGRKKWEATNNAHVGEEDEFKLFDVNAIDGGESAPQLNNTAIFGIKLSTTWKSHGHGGHTEEFENKEWICKDWSQVDWNDMRNNPDCTSIEDSIRNGHARIWFEQNLFQAGCEDDQCDLRVDHCREVGLTPQRLEVDAEGFSQTVEQVMWEVDKMSEADSWNSLVEKFVRVSAAASTQAYDDTMELFNRLVVRGKKTKFMKDIPDYCEHDYFIDGNRNPNWESEPCCNWELRQYQCCAPKDIANGEIDIVLGVNRAQVSTYCEGHSSEVENLLQDVMVAIDQSSSCAEELESSVSANVWDETWKVKDVCHQKMYDAESMACEKDEDCSHCSQSTCRLEAGSTIGKCQVPWDDNEGCMLECLSKEMDPELVRYLREEWQVPATASDEIFRDAFVERMTEPACSGPRAWEEDIGRNGYEWQCNTTCTANHLCDDWDYMEHLRQVARDEGGPDWIEFWDEAVCESYGGKHNNWGQCEFDSLATAPCKQENECYKECQKPHSPDGCAELNGTWIHQPDGWGRCCPPDTHVFYDTSRGEKICSYVPEGSPNGWELRSPACCEAEQGSWKELDGRGECCLGRWMSYTYEGQTHSYCSTETWGWDNSECYESCDALRQECQTCRVEKMECCGEVYKSANRTACESYMECTDSSIWEGSGQTCDDPAPFCARCHGKHCYKTGEPSSCFVNIEQQECEGGLEGLSTEWLDDWHRCKVVTDSVNASGWDCFTPGPTVCPNPTDYPWSYHHNDGLVPKTQWGEQTCDRGCYIPILTDRETCEASSNYETGIYYYWDTYGGDGNGVCKVHNVANETECTVISGLYVPYSLTFNSGRFGTEDECNEGICMGNLGHGGWSREQCESNENFSCTRSCQHCMTWNWPFNSQGGGGCFSENMTTCANEGATQVPCVVSSTPESDCVASNDLQVEWRSCSSYDSNAECHDENGLDPYAQLLGCSWNWGQCETQEACEAVGECDDWENQRHTCQDPNWEHGDSCWASYLVETTNEDTQQVTSTYEYANCNGCRDHDGVCVEPRSDAGCGDMKWHRLGCKVFGLYDEASCKSANATNKWYTRAKTKDECLAMKGCKEPGRHLSELPPDECALCGGELDPLYKWHGGAWVKPKVQNLTWVEGTHMAPINEWKPAIADYLLEKELALPIIKRFANRKQTQALLMFNIFSEALQTLACACGSGNRTGCFDSTEGSISGVSKAFCGLETPINAACGTAMVKKSCLTEEERRSRRLSETDNTGDSMDITWIHYSAGTYGKCFEPYGSSDDRVLQNPLAVKNAHGIVIGQLVGDGKGFLSTGDFDSIELCLDRRSDIREWDTFDVLDVGKRSDDGVTIVPQYNTEWVVNDGLKMCFIATSDGVYFPISRADASWVDLNNLDSPGACDNTKGISLYNATSNVLVCICRCGYAGDTCSAGCPNNCSGHGECLENGHCSCSATRTGVDCGEFNCPSGLQGKRCSGQGLCKEDATCDCEDNFMGVDCSTTKVLPQEVATPPSFDDFQTSQVPDEPPSQISSAPSPSMTPSRVGFDKSKIMYFWGILDRKVQGVQAKYKKLVSSEGSHTARNEGAN